MSRLINNQIWNARSFANLSVEDKLLFLYLETSPETNYYGVFMLPLDLIISARTGLDPQKVKASLDELQKQGKICLVGDYLIIFDYFDRQKNNESEKTRKGLENFEKSLPNKVLEVWSKGRPNPLDTPLIPPSSPLEESKVKESEINETVLFPDTNNLTSVESLEQTNSNIPKSIKKTCVNKQQVGIENQRLLQEFFDNLFLSGMKEFISNNILVCPPNMTYSKEQTNITMKNNLEAMLEYYGQGIKQVKSPKMTVIKWLTRSVKPINFYRYKGRDEEEELEFAMTPERIKAIEDSRKDYNLSEEAEAELASQNRQQTFSNYPTTNTI